MEKERKKKRERSLYMRVLKCLSHTHTHTHSAIAWKKRSVKGLKRISCNGTHSCTHRVLKHIEERKRELLCNSHTHCNDLYNYSYYIIERAVYEKYVEPHTRDTCVPRADSSRVVGCGVVCVFSLLGYTQFGRIRTFVMGTVFVYLVLF